MGLREGTLSKNLSDRFRKRRDQRLRQVIRSIFLERGKVSIVDMGGTVEYWRRVGLDFLREHGAHVTLINLHAAELGDNPDSELFTHAVGDACSMPQYADGAFDLAHSNSVIEHVQTWQNMRNFAAETRRVAVYHYVQTPYFWFPIDPHYYRFPLFHWLPRPLRARLFMKLPIAHVGKVKDWGAAYAIADASRLLGGGQFRYLFNDAVVSFERIMGLPKSLIAIRAPRGGNS